VLWSFAVAQPLYDVLRENREFFVAHRTTPLDLVFLVVLVTLVLPGLLALAPALLSRLSARAGESLHLGLVAVLLTAFTSQVFAHTFNMPSVPHYALAAAVAILATWVYSSVPAIRTFMTYLGPSVLIFPALFLFHPSMAAFVRPIDVSQQAAAAMPAAPPPIVMVVFDQLPLTSLLSESGAIDPRYPNFAALADDATWFRNATTVADLTGWAIPAILTGLTPQRARLPTVQDYPFNLFTTLGTTYRREVIEPITHLCPDHLCEASVPVSERLGVLSLDASIVYLHTALPWDLRALLPPLTQDWKNFVQAQNLQMRWISARDADRREGPRRFIGGISRTDPQPTLYFLHALLPHEPYLYLRSGQQFTEDPLLFGLKATGRWVEEPWPVVQAYGRHLIQLQYVDTLVGQLTDKLKAEGLYDKSLIIITGDHGVSFRPGRPFKGIDEETLPDIMSVPLFVKLPGQQSPVVSDRNVQSIDIVPTIADVLKTTLPWRPDGRSAFASDAVPTMKFIRHTGATRQVTIDTQEFATRRGDAVARKFQLFGAESADMMPTIANHAELIGRPVDAVDRADDGPLHVVVDRPGQYLKFDPAGPTLLGVLSGRVLDDRGGRTTASLAIVVNGQIRATTTTYQFSGDELWTAFVPPRHFHAGSNEVEVFVIRERPGGVRLERAYASSARPNSLNLASRGAHDYWFVDQAGFYGREGGPIPYQWTNGEGALTVPLDRSARPHSLRLGVAKARPATPLTVSLNGCTVYEGTVEETPWFRTFALDKCSRAAFEGSELRIILKSSTAPEKGPGSRQLGIAVEAVNLLIEPWPPARPEPSKSLATVEPLAPLKAPIGAGSTLDVQLANRGKTVWLTPSEASNRSDGVDIALRWRTRGANGPDAEQRMALPRTVYPQDRTVLTVPVVVPDQLRNHGPWQLTVAPVFHDGRLVKVEPPFTVDVVDAGK
jgi:arylsulfatase A-like enzyme